MGFVRIFWKNNIQEAYLPKTSLVGQIVSEILAQLMLEWLHANPSKFDFCLSIQTQDKFRSISSKILTNPMISQI